MAEFLDAYLAARKDLKPATLTVLGHTRRCLVKFFGASKLLRSITPADAEAFRVWLATEANDRDNGRDELSDNTVRRRTGIAKQVFRAAQKRRLIESNPFAGLTAQVRGNRARQYFVTRDEIQKVIDAAPNLEWRTIITLSRYSGLRVPSELLALRWSDVDLPAGRMTIRSTKTEHHESGGIRVCPIFPELRPYLEAARKAADPGAEFVITGCRCTNANLRTRFRKIIARAGLEPWPKLFHNLRASRQTELLDCFPVKAVCEWLGNSQAVALEHYAQVTDDHFRAAAGVPASDAEAKGEAEAKQFPKQQASAGPSTASQSGGKPRLQTIAAQALLQGDANPCDSKVNLAKCEAMGGKGLMTSAANSCGAVTSANGSKAGEAKSEAVLANSAQTDPDLAGVIAAWPRLRDNVRAAIRAIVDAAASCNPDSAR